MLADCILYLLWTWRKLKPMYNHILPISYITC